MQDAAALLQALRLTFPDELARWFPLMPMSAAGPSPMVLPGASPMVLPGASPMVLRGASPMPPAKSTPLPPPRALPPSASRRVRDPARALGLDLADLRVLYRALRVAWLAELVFGGRDEARRWLCTPKRRLHGRVPLLLCQHGRYAAVVEAWLVDIDEGNGP
jgi:hypothetical protein